MWRQNNFARNFDSDQSISDEENSNDDLVENSFSLNSNTEKAQGLLLHSRLEILRGTKDNELRYFVEDEVEMPDFPNDGGLNLTERKESTSHPDEEIISDVDQDDCAFSNSIDLGATELLKDNKFNSFESQKQDLACTWSMISKEADALIHLNDNALCSVSAFSQINKSCKGVRVKVKPKFSLRFKMCKDRLPQHSSSTDENVTSSSIHGTPEQAEPSEDGTGDNSNVDFLEGFHGENGNHLKILSAEVEALGNGLIKHSMAELISDLQDKNVVLRGNTKMSRRTRGKRAQFILRKGTSPLGERIIDDEEHPFLVVSGSSGDDEVNHQSLNVANPVMKKQTMADQFQEALAATSFSNGEDHVTSAKLSGIGLFGKLQQVMQSAKERDADFLNRIKMGPGSNDESHSLVVKILSRHMDAKLIVCRCLFGQDIEGFPLPDSCRAWVDRGKEKTVIFSPKVCGDVDLEVGNFICIHSPWKEVQMMGNDESIILSTYFSHV